MDLLALSEVRWGYFRTRKQFLLSRAPERWRVAFAQPPGSGGDDPWTPRAEGRVTTFTVPFLKPATTQPIYNAIAATRLGRAAIARAATRHLARRVAGLGLSPEVVMISNIYAVRSLAALRPRLTVYDFNDSPFQFAGSPTWAREYWARTLERVDMIFAVSEHYRRQLAAETAKPVILLGNGVEFDHFAAPREEPDDMRDLPRPRIGYLGLLSHFLDFDVLEALRSGLGGGTLVLAGPGSQATEARVAALVARGGGRVVRLGPRAYADAPATMQAFDVGVIPFRAQDPYVQGINPNKVYQYLASGIPVVTTPLLDLPAAPPMIQFASDPAGFGAAVARALAASRDAGAIRTLARGHDWDAIAARMVSEIERRLPGA
ncbi:MAG: glycosyltransferase [Candidatus Eisenbacteria bacterium]|uniref:Glycosyltransferase n=1 Tax=Eiseniibacteriota bacterium TaxID=2212470 RepID=A0A9D6QJT7_UNCEI|nr:glycosyltransferase [Candidatus Eisenbacteria bacterium]MBI3539600.1 glycosyltransferase [Candidatus Eisenbacteria bacterium]